MSPESPIPMLKTGLVAAFMAAAIAVHAETPSDAAANGARSATAPEDTLEASSDPAPAATGTAAAAEAAVPSKPGIAAAPAAAAAGMAAAGNSPVQDGVPELPTQEVVGRRRTAGSTVDNTAMKLGASLHETPRSVTVLGAERIREQNFSTVASTMDYVPGVFRNSNAREGYHYYSRGYRMAAVDTRVDGFAGINAGGDMSSNLFGVEQVAYLRGPAGILYGASGAPGGMINLVTKKPQEAQSRQLEVEVGPFGGSSVGNNATYGLEADFTGPLTQDGRVLYRALANVEDVSQFTANVLDRNRFAALSLTYKLDGEGRYALTPMASYTRLSRPDGRGISISPSSSRTANDGREDINFDDLSPMDVNLSAGGRLDQQFLGGFDFRAAPTDAIRLQAGYRYMNYDSDVNQFSPDVATLAQSNPADPKSWTVQRRQTKSVTERWSHGFDVNGSYEFRPQSTSFWKNITQAGVNGRWNGNDRSATAQGARQSPINIYTGAATAAPKDSNLTLVESFLASSFAFNAYIQDQVSLADGRWVATLGLGYAQETPDRDYRPTSIDPDTVKGLDAALSTRYGEPTPNLALLFNATRSLALYASYASSYTLAPGEREDRSGNVGGFEPERGVNYETGLKYDAASLGASLNLALFHLERYNVMAQSATTDLNPNGVRYYTQKDGEGVISRGVELSGEVQPLRNWRLSAGGAYLLAKYQSALDKVSDGAPADKSPEWSGNLFTRYDIEGGPLRGLGASLGAVYQGERLSAIRTTAAPDPLVLPYFVRLDAGVYFRVNSSVDFALNIENLNDERRMALDGNTGTNIEMGAPRRITFRTGYRL